MTARPLGRGDRLLGGLALALLAVAVVFGGASQGNVLRLALVELASLPVLLLAIARLTRARAWPWIAWPVALLAAVILVPLVQLIPLPPGVWTRLAGRADLVTALGLARVDQPWAPISLVPEATWRSLLALLPPAAMLLAVLGCEPRQRLWLLLALPVLALASMGLGLAQLAGGPHSPLYLYDIANFGLPIGVFANRNHQSSFLLVALPAVGLMMTEPLGAERRRLPAVLGLALAGLLVVGVIATRSRAGVLLLGPVVVASLAIAWRRGRFAEGGRTLAALVCGLGVVGLIAAQFVVAKVLPRFNMDHSPEFRFDAWPRVFAAARHYLPFGSGIGTFDPVYRSVEPLGLLQAAYFNHAHNDYLELWLETGLVGLTVLAVFAAWLAAAAVRAWSQGARARGGGVAMAGAVIAAILLAHSLVDYPLRTEALATVFALACGLLAEDGALAARTRNGAREVAGAEVSTIEGVGSRRGTLVPRSAQKAIQTPLR